jgi:hypothetical protein
VFGQTAATGERPDRELASRQRPPFVPIHSRESLRHVGKNCCQFELSIPLAQQCAPAGLGIAERAGEQIMARKPYATKINLSFSNSAREFMNFETTVRSGNFPRQCCNLFRKCGI